MKTTMYIRRYGSYKRNITKYIGKNRDRSETIYKCETRLKDKRIKGASLYSFLCQSHSLQYYTACGSRVVCCTMLFYSLICWKYSKILNSKTGKNILYKSLQDLQLSFLLTILDIKKYFTHYIIQVLIFYKCELSIHKENSFFKINFQSIYF